MARYLTVGNPNNPNRAYAALKDSKGFLVYSLTGSWTSSAVVPTYYETFGYDSYFLQSEYLTVKSITVSTHIGVQFYIPPTPILLNLQLSPEDASHFTFVYMVGLSSSPLNISYPPYIATFNLVRQMDYGVVYGTFYNDQNAAFPQNFGSNAPFRDDFVPIDNVYNIFQKNYYINVVAKYSLVSGINDIEDYLIYITNKYQVANGNVAIVTLRTVFNIQIDLNKP